jgi:predicted ATPase
VRDLGSHRLKDLQQPEQVFQFLHADLPAEFPPLRSLEAFAHNLPRQLTSFVGRERAIEEVKRLLATTSLLTLTGAGGCGKTRLALQVAAEMADELPDGVWLVELAALTDPALLPQATAAALGVRERPDQPPSVTLTEHLRARTLLLLLDNCEHLIEASAQLAQLLLRSCPHLRLLTTSREALGVAGEQTYPVPSLSLPDTRDLPPLDQLHQFEAIRLFRERAALSQPGFALTPANARLVTQVCHRLDGIPLAIELAAARVRALPIEQIAARLDDRFRLLTGGSRTALPRQQTLRALIDWSYDLLAEPERTLLRRLSVFAGGWTLEAAEAVCAGLSLEPRALSLEKSASDSTLNTQRSTLPLAEWQVLDLLTALVDKSLVQYEEQAAGPRYRLLETIRQYGRDRLLEAGEATAIRGQHRDWFLELAERAEPELFGARQGEWLDRLEREHDNLRAALEWCRAEEGGRESGLRMAGSLLRFWTVRGHICEGHERLIALLSPAESAPTPGRARALIAAASLSYSRGDLPAAAAFCQEGRSAAQEVGDLQTLAHALNLSGTVARIQGGLDVAGVFYEDSMAVSRNANDAWNTALAYANLALIPFCEEDYQRAADLFAESLTRFRHLGDTMYVATDVHFLGRIAQHQGDYARAVALHKESLDLYRETGNLPGLAYCLDGLAGVATARGEPERAARLLGAEEALRETHALPVYPAIRVDHERNVAATRAALSAEAFAAAWAEGRAMALEQAIEDALRET